MSDAATKAPPAVALFAGLLDDAAIFPPGNAPMADALRLSTCVRVGVPFELTAGLHDAVRHRDPVTGFEHHGLLNVLVAVAAALEGAEVEHVLAERDGERLAGQVRDLPEQGLLPGAAA